MPIDHIVRQGETTIGLSEQHGLFAETIWNDSANAKLKSERRDMNVLLPGDSLVIPDKRLKEVSKPDGKKHRFVRKGVPARFRLQVFAGEEPRAGQKYRLTIDGKISKGTTDANGVLETFVPPGAQEGVLVIGPDDFELVIRFGCLNPASDLTGIQHRLANLGFFRGAVSGEPDDTTRQAVSDFQERFQLEVTGELNQATKDKLDAAYEQTGEFPSKPKKK